MAPWPGKFKPTTVFLHWILSYYCSMRVICYGTHQHNKKACLHNTALFTSQKHMCSKTLESLDSLFPRGPLCARDGKIFKVMPVTRQMAPLLLFWRGLRFDAGQRRALKICNIVETLHDNWHLLSFFLSLFLSSLLSPRHYLNKGEDICSLYVSFSQGLFQAYIFIISDRWSSP